jgi:hypothetical protein
LNVIGTWNVAPGVVRQSPPIHEPLSHAQLEKSTVMDPRVLFVPLSPTASPNSVVRVAWKLVLGTFPVTFEGIALYPDAAEPPPDALGPAKAGLTADTPPMSRQAAKMLAVLFIFNPFMGAMR